MLDAKWARYFRAILLLTLVMPACGGSALVIDGTDAGGRSPARCAIVEHDATVIYTATVGSFNESDAGPSAAAIEWRDDAGASVWCRPGPSGCDARCPSGQTCSVAFLTHALVTPGGTCL